MERSPAARIGRPPTGARRVSGQSAGGALAARPAGLASGALWPLRRFADAGRVSLEFARRRRLLMLGLLGALVLLCGGWLVLRHSSLVAVEHVQVSGVPTHSPQAGEIDAALAASAHGMSTLEVSTAKLEAALTRFPIVRSVRAHALFPHGLRVDVVEQPPVATLEAGGTRTAVAADGVVLGAGLLSGSLPLVHTGSSAGAEIPLTGHSVQGVALLSELAVLGAAPRQLAALITNVYSGPYGVTVALAGRVRAYFGDATRPHAKWLSLARVLADPSSSGAVYVDVRVPERPAAGFAAGASSPGYGPEAGLSSGSDPTTAAALAAGLEEAVAGGTSPTSSAAPAGGEAEAASSGAGAASTPAPSQPAQATAPGAPETPAQASSPEG
jgi:cell division protein FtsQ